MSVRDPETIEDVRSRRGVRIQSKHRDVTGEHECQSDRNPNILWQDKVCEPFGISWFSE